MKKTSKRYGTKEDEIKVYGETEARNMYKIRSFVDAGAVTSFHTDGAGTPLEQIFVAATRRTVKDAQISLDRSQYTEQILNAYPDEIRGAEETIDGITSLKCLTRNPAYQLKEENNLGSIEVGKAADFTIFNVDLTDNDAVTDVSVVGATLLSVFSNGKMTYPANQY